MRLPWRKPNTTKAVEDARRARERAQADLERMREQSAKVRAETPHYRAWSERLRDLREKNHFAEALQATIRGGNP